MKTTNVFCSAARAMFSFRAEMNTALLLDNSLLLSIFIMLILGLLILPALLAPQSVRSLTNRFSFFIRPFCKRQKESTSGSAGFGEGRFLI